MGSWLDSLIQHWSGMEHDIELRSLSHAAHVQAVPTANGSQTKPNREAPSTVLRDMHAERSMQPDLRPNEKTAPETLAISGD